MWKDVYPGGSSELTHPADCSIYLVNCGDLVLIGTGVGLAFNQLVANIKSLGFDSKRLSTIILTHAHIDHIVSAWQLNRKFKAQVIAHELDAEAISSGVGIVAEFYGVSYHPCSVRLKLKGPEDRLRYGPHELRILHIPGHTPGSVALYIEMGKRVLFGQEVHGPYFLPGANTGQAKSSLQTLLLDLQADILSIGHFSGSSSLDFSCLPKDKN